MRSSRIVTPFLLALALTGCARAVEVGSAEPGRTYRIEVRNETGVAMIVRYDDGRGRALLGTVPAERTEYFTIASPASEHVEVIGTSESGARTAGPYPVVLSSSRTLITLR